MTVRRVVRKNPEREADPEILDKAAPPLFPRRLFSQRVTRFAIATTILVSVGLFSYIKFKTSVPAQFRSGANSLAIEITTPTEGSQITGFRPDFRWVAVPGADSYRLYVFNDDGTMMWKWETWTPHLIPVDELPLRPDTRYLWRVEAQFPDGLRLSSPLHVFRSPR